MSAPYAERDGGDWYVVSGDHSDRLAEGFASRRAAEALIRWLGGEPLPRRWGMGPSGSGELSWSIDCAGRPATLWARAVRREFPDRGADLPLDAAKLFPAWEDLAAGGLIAITDNGGETADRYSAWFRDGDVLAYNDIPTMPQGFSQWGGSDLPPTRALEMLTEPGSSEMLVWPREPSEDGRYALSPEKTLEDAKGHALHRINEAYADAMADLVKGGSTPAEAREQIIAECMTHPAFTQSP